MADPPPIRLSDLTSITTNLYGALKGDVDVETARKLRAAIRDFQDELDEILNLLHLKSDNWQKEWDKAKIDERRKWLRELEVKYTLVEGAPVDLAEFFKRVSSSVINAQQELNEFSEQYVRDLAVYHPQLPPAYYSIPSVKAEMRIGLNQLSSRGINIIFFNKKEQRDEYLESTITFEMVSVPAPLTSPPTSPLSRPLSTFGAPKSISSMNSLMPAKMFAAEEAETSSEIKARSVERESVLNQISNLLEKQGQSLGKIYENARDEAVVLKHAAEQASKYLVVWPSKTANTSVESWRELSIFHLAGSESSLQLDASVFEKPPKEGYLRILSRNQLLKESKDDLADMIINLGDALININLILSD